MRIARTADTLFLLDFLFWLVRPGELVGMYVTVVVLFGHGSGMRAEGNVQI